MDLRISDEEERRELLEALEEVFCHGRFILGPEVGALEARIAALTKRRFAVGVGSGTDALFVGLKGLGIGPGDEVIVPALSYIATANAVALTGARPVFADIREDLNMDPESVRKRLGRKTRAILPVHYTGRICDMPALEALAARRGIPVIEDAAQAFGAALHGRPAGNFGRIACFSMNPMKVFAACGEAGMIVTDDPALHERLVALRYNGLVNREECIETGHNGRLDTVQAAVLLRRLKRVHGVIEARRRHAEWYDDALRHVVEVPPRSAGSYDAYYTYTIRTPKRDALMAFLMRQGIETKIHHPYLMSQQPVYRKGAAGRCPRAEKLVRQVLCLPVNEKLTQRDLETVAGAVRAFFKR